MASFPGTYTFTSADQGVHTFAFGVTLYTAGPQTVTASDGTPDNSAGTSNTITVSPNTANHLTVAAPSPATAGSAFGVTVTAFDQYNNKVPGYAGTVTLSTTGDTAATFVPASGTLTSGVGVFSATLFTAAPSRTLTANGTGFAAAYSTNVGVVAAPASQFSVVAPATVVEGSTVAVTVTALDPYDNPDPTYNNFVTLTNNLTGVAVARTVTGGTGVFSVTLNTPGTQSLTASDTHISGTSNTIAVTQATHFALSAAALPGGRRRLCLHGDGRGRF